MGAARSIGTVKLVVALVCVPVKLFTAASAKRVSFNRLHKGCGSRVTNGARCASEGVDLGAAEIVRAFEYQPDRYVEFTDDELSAIRSSIDEERVALTEFVPVASIDAVALDKAYFLGPDKGCEKDYAVIAQALERRRVAGVGMWGGELAIVRPLDKGLVIHTAFFAHETRSLADVLGDGAAAPRAAVEAAERLVQHMARDEFDPGRFSDRFAVEIAEAVQRKVEGKKVIVPPAPPGTKPLELVDALERSLAMKPAKAAVRKRGKAA